MRLIERKVKDNTLVELLAKQLWKKPHLIRYHVNKYKNPRWETKWQLTQAINKIEWRTEQARYSILDLFGNDSELWEK